MHWKTAIRMLALASLLPSGVARRLGSAFSLLTASLIHRQISRKFAGLVEYGSSCGGVYIWRAAASMPWELSKIIVADMARLGWKGP
jgi:asparagine synthase (glutamine-hydrolysing)